MFLAFAALVPGIVSPFAFYFFPLVRKFGSAKTRSQAGLSFETFQSVIGRHAGARVFDRLFSIAQCLERFGDVSEYVSVLGSSASAVCT